MRLNRFDYDQVYGRFDRKIDRRLAYAIWKEDEVMVEQALKNGADPNAKNFDGKPIAGLCLTASRRHCLPPLVAAGLRIEDVSEWTQEIHGAACEGDLAILAWCIEIGIDVNARDSQGMTALMYAAQFGDEDCCRMLLDAGANARLKCPLGETAADYADAMGMEENAEILRAAMKKRWRKGG